MNMRRAFTSVESLKTGMCKRSAFTLVELLVVIGIIALLISILLPSLNKARKSAQRVQCASNIRQMTMSLLHYANNNRGIFPTGTYIGAMLLGDRLSSPAEVWDTYGLNRGIVYCPANGSTLRPTKDDLMTPLNWGGGQYQILLAYTYLGGFGGYVSTPTNSWNGWPRVRIGNIEYPPSFSLTQKARNSSEAPLLLDRAWDTPVAIHPNGIEASNHIDSSGKTEGENVGYVDGHVQWYQWADVKAQNRSFFNTYTTVYY